MKSSLRPLELLLRHGIVYPLLRLVFRNSEVTTGIRLQTVRKLLILRYDRIGDIIVTTPVLRKLKHSHPDLRIGVLASKSNADLVRTNPFVDRLHILPDHWWQWRAFLREARREQYDVVLNFIFNRTTSGGVLANLIAPKGIKVGQGADKYRFYFNKLMHLERGRDHMADVLLKYVGAVFDLPRRKGTTSFEIVVDEQAKHTVNSFLKDFKITRRRFIVLNISSTESVKQMSRKQADVLAQFLATQCRETVVVISAPSDSRVRNEITTHPGKRLFPFPPQGDTDMLTIAELIRESKAVITPDTSIIHVASAMGTPVMGLYTPLQVTNEWLPYGVMHRMVLAGNGEPVSSIKTETLEFETRAFLKSLKRTSDGRNRRPARTKKKTKRK
ncbi:MAG: glycosyltransferase family 9 protein [Bacteroidota bacterium]